MRPSVIANLSYVTYYAKPPMPGIMTRSNGLPIGRGLSSRSQRTTYWRHVRRNRGMYTNKVVRNLRSKDAARNVSEERGIRSTRVLFDSGTN